MDDERILYLIDTIMSDPVFDGFYVSSDEYDCIIIEGNYFTVTVDVKFDDDYMEFDSYTVSVTGDKSSSRDFIYRFYDVNDAYEAAEELSRILNALESYDGVILPM